MIASTLVRLLNLPALWRYLRTHRADRSVHDPAEDLELALYGAIFANNFLHYGYFRELPVAPESISLLDVNRAMDDYASLLVDRVSGIALGQAAGASPAVLDVGCGMGGLLARLSGAGLRPTGLTPNRAHAAHIRASWPQIPLVESTLEAWQPAADLRFDAVCNAESFQYIDIELGMRKIRSVLAPGGRWIVVDYFRLRADAANRSGHLLTDFEVGLKHNGFDVVEHVDITENCVPSLAYARLLATRFAIPIVRFGVDKLMLSRPLLGYLFEDAARQRLARIRLDTLDPDVFRRDKRYLLMTLAAR